MLNEIPLSQGVDALTCAAGVAAAANPATSSRLDPLEVFLAEMQASMAIYKNSVVQYDLGATGIDSAAV